MLLAIDTSSLVLSTALMEKDRLISEWTVQRKLTHSEQLIPHMDTMMKEAGVRKSDITAVAVSIGPGSFTGLRIGLATAKMLAYIWKVPLIGVDTLEALAWNFEGMNTWVLPLMDAQRGNVYTALYEAGDEVVLREKETVLSIEDTVAEAKKAGVPVIATGEAADVYRDILDKAGIRVAPPAVRCTRAASVARAAFRKLEKGEVSNPLSILPNYIRRSEAEVQWEKRHGKNS